MKELTEYEYDLFLSWTGADRELKNSVADYFKEKYGEDFKIYDSDTYCNGDFRTNYCEALDKSKVYVLILTDNLHNNAAGHITEVRSELSLALELEANCELNIVILCFSPFFRFDTPPHRNATDEVGWFFYTHTRGFSRIDGLITPENTVAPQTLEKLNLHVSSLIKARNEGKPALSQAPRSSLVTEKVAGDEWFFGREKDIKDIDEAFSSGAQLVVLSGMGGIGKTKLAEAFARYSDENDLLRCVQIVHVQDMSEDRSGLNVLVSEAMYENSLLLEIAQFSQKDQYNRKLNALRELPEYTLLVLDNFNTVNDKAVADIISSLKCRMLITSRGTVDERTFNGKVKLIKLEKLDEQPAYEMFIETAGREVDRELFNSLYTALGGHTITLCMTAKILREHPDTDLNKLAEELDDIGSVTEKTEFAHNESNGYDTLLGHLKKLFDVSALDGECTRILRHMSLISDGTIAVSDLMRALDLRDDNSVLYLVRGGWLERVNVDGESGVRLHSILSQLVQSLDGPTEENCAEIIKYLCDTYDNMRDNILLAKVGFMEDRLYFALYRLALSSGRLCGELWDRFVDLSHLTGNLEDLKSKTENLKKHLDDGGSKKLVTSYYDMVVLERRPAEIQIIEKYVDNLRENSGDYKWVLRALSVTLDYVGLHPDYKSLLRGIIKTAITAAEERRDDFGVLNLSWYYLLANSGEAYANLKKYVKLRKKEKAYNGTVLYIDQIITGISAFGGDLDEAYVKMLGYVDAYAKDDDEANSLKVVVKMMLKHPFKFFKGIKINKAAKNLPRDDELKFFLEALNGFADSVTYGGEINAQELFDMTVRFYEMSYTRGMTLSNLQEKLENLIAFIKRFPEHMQGEIRKIAYVCDFDPKTATLGSYARLQIACLINGSYNDKMALTQSNTLLEFARAKNAENHYAVVSELIRHGNTLVSFCMIKEAFGVFYEAYEILKENAGDSEKLYEVCRAMLNLYLGADGDAVLKLKDVRDTVIKIFPYSARAIAAASDYVTRVFTVLDLTRGEEIFEKRFIEELGGDRKKAEEAVKNYVLAYIPYTVHKIIEEDSLIKDAAARRASTYNMRLAHKWGKASGGFRLTDENVGELNYADLVWLIGSQIKKCYLKKCRLYEAEGVNWGNLALKVFSRRLFSDFDKYKKQGVEFSKLINGSIADCVGNVVMGNVQKKNGENIPVPIDLAYTLTNEEAKKEIEKCSEESEALKKKYNFVTFALKRVYENDEDRALEFYAAADAVLEQAKNFKRYPVNTHTGLLSNLSSVYYSANKLKLDGKLKDDSYLEKLYSAMEHLRKYGNADLRGKAEVCLARADYFKETHTNIYKRGERLTAVKVVKLALKYKTDICNHVRFAMCEVIMTCVLDAKNGGFKLFTGAYVGVKGKYRKLVEKELSYYKDKAEQSQGEEVTELGLLTKISNEAGRLSTKNYNISTHEFYRLANKRFKRYERYAYTVLHNILVSLYGE